MPRLSLFQLTKVFAAGFLGYAVLVTLFSVGIALLFPSYIIARFDMSIDTFLELLFVYLGFLGAMATFLMLIGAWVVLRLFRRGV
jgi:hypothetical protein